MSTFLGQISEIQGISVDRFDGDNLKSSVFFLSHCHWDHMTGLKKDFFQYLIESDKYIYCSPISKAFLLGIFPGSPEERIKEIVIAVPMTIKYTIRNNENSLATTLTVITSPAGHCPGSVMFVFIKDEKTILYTGDFRINPEDLPKLNPLNDKIDGKNLPKRFDTVYLDTTFLSLDFHSFPSRKESCEEIGKVVRRWLRSDSRNAIVIECSATYGPEYLFMEISKLLNIRIHVKNKVYSNYTRIAELAKYVTNDGTSTRIHACKPKLSDDKLWCRSDVETGNILTVVPSVMRWRGKLGSRFAEYDPGNNRKFYVCHSMHASYKELIAFVDYFKPDKIVPCVVPGESMEFHNLIRKLTSYQRKTKAVESCKDFKLAAPIPSKISKLNFRSKYFNDDDDDDDC